MSAGVQREVQSGIAPMQGDAHPGQGRARGRGSEVDGEEEREGEPVGGGAWGTGAHWAQGARDRDGNGPLCQQAVGFGRADFRATGPGPCAARPAHMPAMDLEATLGHDMGGGWDWEGGRQTMHMPLQAHFGPARGPYYRGQKLN
jgi:hypothetical protein